MISQRRLKYMFSLHLLLLISSTKISITNINIIKTVAFTCTDSIDG